MDKIKNLNEVFEFLMARTQKSTEGGIFEVKFSTDEMFDLLEKVNQVSRDSIKNRRALIDVSRKILRNSKIKQDFKDEILEEIDPVIDFLHSIVSNTGK